MNSKVLRVLRRSVGVTVLAGGLMAAGAGVAFADSEWPAHNPDPKPIQAPENGPLGPLTISGEAAGNDAALTVTTDDASAVVSGRAHLETPADSFADEVVRHDGDKGSLLGSGRGVDIGTDHLGLVGGATGDASSIDVVGTGRVGEERRYFIQPVPGPDTSWRAPSLPTSLLGAVGPAGAPVRVPNVGINPIGPPAIVPMLGRTVPGHSG